MCRQPIARENLDLARVRAEPVSRTDSFISWSARIFDGEPLMGCFDDLSCTSECSTIYLGMKGAVHRG